jgi:hypothetical protein
MGLQLKEEKKPEQTSFLILLDAKDKNHLMQIAQYLDENEIEHHMFFEPDYDMGYTSICSEPVSLEKRHYFKKFKLYK